MKPFVPLPPRRIEISGEDIGATIGAVGFVAAIIGIFMGLMQ